MTDLAALERRLFNDLTTAMEDVGIDAPTAEKAALAAIAVINSRSPKTGYAAGKIPGANVRYVIFWDGASWVAQALELALSTQQATIKAAVESLRQLVEAELATGANSQPSPKEFFDMYEGIVTDRTVTHNQLPLE